MFSVFFPAFVFTCYGLRVRTVCAEERGCGHQMPSNCHLYIGQECEERSKELQALSGGGHGDTTGGGHGPQQGVHNLRVEPYSSAGSAHQSHSVLTHGLQISWTAPQDSPGVKVTVTALDDASQLTVCRLLDLSQQHWSNGSDKTAMSYNMTLPQAPDVYKWYVRLESLHSTVSVATAFVTTASLHPEASGTACSLVVVMTLSSIDVTVRGVLTQPDVTLYDVILYECDEDCCESFCDLTEVSANNVTSLMQVSRFTQLAPGQYQVWAQPSKQPDDVCAISPAFTVKDTATPPTPYPSPTAAPVTYPKEIITSITTLHKAEDTTPWIVTSGNGDNLSSENQDRLDGNVAFEPQPSSPDGGQSWKLVVTIVVCVCVAVVVVVVASLVAFRWWRRKDRSASCMPDLDKWVTTKSQSTEDTVGVTPSTVRTTTNDNDDTSSPTPVFLLAHSRLTHHERATDALALYLQAFCACDVTYFRWHLEDIRLLGPELWCLQQMGKSSCVIVVHSPDTQRCYDEWRTGELKENSGGVEVRILAAAFDYLTQHTAEKATQKFLNITFYSQRDFAASDYCPLFTRPSKATSTQIYSSQVKDGVEFESYAVIPRSSNATSTQRDSSEVKNGVECEDKSGNTGIRCDNVAAFGKGVECVNDKGTATFIARNISTAEDDGDQESCGPDKSRSVVVDSADVYRLMNDFSDLLADVHGCPNFPSEFKGRNLPIDSDHLDSHEGRLLYQAVASLHREDESVTGLVFGEGESYAGHSFRDGKVLSCAEYFHPAFGRAGQISAKCETAGFQGSSNAQRGYYDDRYILDLGSNNHHHPLYNTSFETETSSAPHRGVHEHSKEETRSPINTVCRPIKGTANTKDTRTASSSDFPAHTGVNTDIETDTTDTSSGSPARKDKVATKRMDSGFDEHHSLSFIGPDDLSAVDTEVSSLGARFMEINARYEKRLEDGFLQDDCYTLGGRYV